MPNKKKFLSAVTLPSRVVGNDPSSFVDETRRKKVATVKGNVQIDAQLAAESRRAGGNSTDRLQGRPSRKPATISIGRAAISAPSGGIRKLGRKPFDI